jgi:hypothetical protein
MPFRNRVRLPFYITRPQFPTEQNVFRLADGSSKTLSAVVRKVYEGETNYFPEALHERLVIALKHDDVTIEGYRYLGGVSTEGDYEIEWNNFLDYPIAKASFKVQVTPFNYSNDNCQTCDVATQLSLEDDTVTSPYEVLEEGQEYEYNVFTNDSICCSPVTAEIVTINSTYVDSASIDATSGVVTITMKATTPSATLANLLTYRVTCPNGSYDDADVFANVDGSEEVCEPPSNLLIISADETEAEISWDTVVGATEYDWQLFLATDLFNPVQTGSEATNSATLTGLTPGTEYVFYVQTDCGDGDLSTFSNIPFETTGESVGCGMYEIFIFGGEPFEYTEVTHMSCAGNQVNAFVQNQSSTVICSMESAPGVPVQIIGADDIQYLGPC